LIPAIDNSGSAPYAAIWSGIWVEYILELPEIQAGLNTPAFLLNGMSSREACERAQRRGLEVWPLDRYAIVRRDLRGLILGFAAFNAREIRGGVTELARALGKG
jgi:GntR family transcriptional regulator/MocR family aminotransferase